MSLVAWLYVCVVVVFVISSPLFWHLVYEHEKRSNQSEET